MYGTLPQFMILDPGDDCEKVQGCAQGVVGVRVHLYIYGWQGPLELIPCNWPFLSSGAENTGENVLSGQVQKVDSSMS